MRLESRSDCPINLTLEILGDRWSLIVIRDMMFGNRRYFRQLLNESEERIASNILSSRLKHLLEEGFVSKREDADHKQKAIYSLTEKSIQLLPILAQIGAWGRKHLDCSKALSIRAELLEKGGPELWERFMDELREVHLGKKRKIKGRSVAAELQAAFEKVSKR